jgi:hypothetical protein
VRSTGRSPLIRICTWCKEKFGEKKPFKDKSKTHGICDNCFASERKRIKKIAFS